MFRLLLLVSLILPSGVWAISLATIRADCRVYIKDSSATRPRYSDSQLLRFINEGQKDISVRARFIRRGYQFELAAGTTYYSMPTDFLHPVRVTWKYQVLDELSIQAMDKNRNWEEVRHR